MRNLIEQVAAALDARLSPDADRPVALALSGGGDSMALLHLAADWRAGRGRRLLALTVDHRLHPDSARWTAFAGDAARALGADWRALAWEGSKPSAGLPAAARAARHALLAEAARQADARVILMAHTADDVAESAWMRDRGATLGLLRDWSPSPAWPEGRGIMLLRPLLDTSRADLRAFLTARGAKWLDDPANVDPRFLRSRARQALSPSPDGDLCLAAGGSKNSAHPRERGDLVLSSLTPGFQGGRSGGDPSPLQHSKPGVPAFTGMSGDEDYAKVFNGIGVAWAGLITLPRAVSGRTLAAALLSVSGGTTPPRGPRLAALHVRLTSGADFVATLGGARVQATGDALLINREPGRRGLPDLVLPPNASVVWDGRFQIPTPGPGWRVGALKGRMAVLGPSDRAVVKTLPASARPFLPVLFRDEDARPVLAWRAAETRCLVAARLLAAAGGIGHEDQLTHSSGETPPADLFLGGRAG